MRPVRAKPIRTHGFSVAELLVVIGMIGVLAVAAFPVFANFLQAQQARGAAQELANLLNQARQLAISTNGSYQVQIEAGNNRLRFVRTSGNATVACNPDLGNPVCIGPGTDGNGYRRLENQATLSATNLNNNNVTFNHLGTGNAGRIKVQNSTGSSSLDVVINSAGQITIQASTL